MNYSKRSDLYLENNNIKLQYSKTKVKVIEKINKDKRYVTIIFNNLNDKIKLQNKLSKILLSFLKKLGITKNSHIFVVGLGNDNHTADSIGPRALKYINVNAFYEKIGLKLDRKVSALEPGVLTETGILTEEILKSIIKKIQPNLLILIDSFVSKDIHNLNKVIEINDNGVQSGSGIKGLSSNIDKSTLKVPVLVIGVITAIEYFDKQNANSYLLSSKDIDEYVNDIAFIIGNAINDVIYNQL